MLITLGFYRRKPGLTCEQFLHHWQHVHGPLFLSIPSLSRYIRRYIQHHVAPNTFFPGVTPLDFDGFSESWFDDAEARRQFLSQPEMQQRIVPDEHNFIDMSATRVQVFDSQLVMISGKDDAQVIGTLFGER